MRINGPSRLAATLPFLLLLMGCAAPLAPYDPIEAKDYPSADGPGERLQPDERENAAKIAGAIKAGVLRRAELDLESHKVRRDAHPKAHGCVRADFRVESALDPSLAKGVFQPNAAYSAWIRFSNGNADPRRSDADGDGRGMAVKLMGVKGRTPLPRDETGGAQDFIMISHPVFIINDGADYERLVRYQNDDGVFARNLRLVVTAFSLGWKGLTNAIDTTAKKIDNPLNARYWSMAPYQLGTGPEAAAIKFSARPCRATETVLPADPAPDFLRQALRETLTTGSACMEFLVQPRSSNDMSVEDSQTEWPEEKAPFRKVATITIPAQIFDTPEQNESCDNLSFTPWHALPEHRPLGAVNRMRKAIYERISDVRRFNNLGPPPHPEPKP